MKKVSVGLPLVSNPKDGTVYEIPRGKVNALGISINERALNADIDIPTKVFDAKRDFGAKGDGVADDTAAIIHAIDAARSYGKRSIAYLPAGTYLVSDTIKIIGSDFTVGGSGFRTHIVWKGPADGTIIAVHDPRNVVLENIAIGCDAAMNNGIDIRQTGSGAMSSMTYDMVTVFGIYQKQANRKGLRLEGLSKNAFVHIKHLEGNVRITDSASATILANTTYEGIVTIEGKAKVRDGFIGFLTRLGTKSQHQLYVNDSQSVVMSDFYIEQADDGFQFTGNAGDPPGRITVQGAKMGTETGPVTVKNYAGEVFIGHHQFFMVPKPMVFTLKGEQPCSLYVFGSMFYDTVPVTKIDGNCRAFFFGNHSRVPSGLNVVDASGANDSDDTSALVSLSRAFDDLRKLGALDRRINHGR